MAMTLSPATPSRPSQPPTSTVVTMVGFVAFAIDTASATWSPWPWVITITSRWSMDLRCSGATGLVCTQGSISMALPVAVRTFHVPCPTHVNLTWSLMGIGYLLRVRPVRPGAEEITVGGRRPRLARRRSREWDPGDTWTSNREAGVAVRRPRAPVIRPPSRRLSY